MRTGGKTDARHSLALSSGGRAGGVCKDVCAGVRRYRVQIGTTDTVPAPLQRRAVEYICCMICTLYVVWCWERIYHMDDSLVNDIFPGWLIDVFPARQMHTTSAG